MKFIEFPKFAIAVLVVAAASLVAEADLRYHYDAAGNRVARVVVEVSQPQKSPRLPDHGGEVAVSPMVTTDHVTVATTLDPNQVHMRFVLSNLQGSVLANGDITEQRTTVSLGHYSCAIYLLTVYIGQSHQSFKITKQ